MAIANTLPVSVDLDATPPGVNSWDSSDDDEETASTRTPDFMLNFVDSSEPSDSDSDNNYPPPHSIYGRHPFLDDEAEEADDDDDE